eukprot:9428363-Lingulodinium_polyedra.AAC.1
MVHGRPFELLPYLGAGKISHEIPASGPSAARLLHQALCARGSDTQGRHAFVIETAPLDRNANEVPGEPEARAMHRRAPTRA